MCSFLSVERIYYITVITLRVITCTEMYILLVNIPLKCSGALIINTLFVVYILCSNVRMESAPSGE